jgi:hypothetical protein
MRAAERRQLWARLVRSVLLPGRVLLAGLAVLAAPGRAGTEHEVPYRFTVLGYVRDGAGLPRTGAVVDLVREKTGLTYYAKSNAEGFYVIVARLTDESLGERLHVRLEAQRLTVVARFDPHDHARERGTRVDFLGGRTVERPHAFASTLREFLAR